MSRDALLLAGAVLAMGAAVVTVWLFREAQLDIDALDEEHIRNGRRRMAVAHRRRNLMRALKQLLVAATLLSAHGGYDTAAERWTATLAVVALPALLLTDALLDRFAIRAATRKE